jgi:DHA1 family bicyclomycin/chloramphenicol resistance-like MFS transporter
LRGKRWASPAQPNLRANLVPVIAPSIGQALLLFSSWHIVFFVFLASALITLIWTFFRLPETLKTQDIRPFNAKAIWHDFLKVIENKITLTYAICTGLIFSSMIGYLTSSRQIFQDYFHVGKLFPLYFGISALSIGISSIVNSLIVRRYGMKLICHYALIIMMAISTALLVISIAQNNQVLLWQFMIFILVSFFCIGLLFGNLNALAMEPMGHVAGMASAVIGFLSSGISVIVGSIIGQAYNNSLIPIAVGFLLLTASAFILQLRLNIIPSLRGALATKQSIQKK